nr:hypothetical protein [Tanacetum cinerariifolium]
VSYRVGKYGFGVFDDGYATKAKKWFTDSLEEQDSLLDAQECKQDKSTLETPVDIEEEILDAEVQENEALSLCDEEIALDPASSEGSMSGPGPGREEGDYGYDDMTNYHDDY